MDSLILQTAIGLVFVFATGAALVSVVSESVSRYVGLRAEFLLRGLRTLLDGGGTFELPFGEAVTGRVSPKREAVVAARVAAASATAPVPEAFVSKLMAHPLVGVTAQAGHPTAKAGDTPLRNKQRRQLPSYVSARSFAQALVDLIPNAAGATTMTEIAQRINDIPPGDIPDRLRRALLSMTNDANADITTFRTNVENWYDDQMARVSGWYKRYLRWVSLAIGLIIVLVFNLNVLTIARSIYTDEAVRGSVVTQATQASKCDSGPANCLQELRRNIGSVRGAGLPIGWGAVPRCAVAHSGCNWIEDRGLWIHNGPGWLSQLAELGVIVIGWAFMVLALLPGANFWFDILSRLGTLRATGPKPTTS